MPLYLQRCLPHTSYVGFFTAFSLNVLPCFGEILYLIYSYHAKTYIDRQAVVPSFWFRWWRPGFLITGILYDVGMLAYCIYIGDVFAVLMAVRITTGLYQLSDQLWMIKNWIPFFVQKEKRRLMFLRVYLLDSVWYLAIVSTSWSGSWQERNVIFANVYYIGIFVICFGCGLWYLIQGGADHLVKNRFHYNRNMFALFAIFDMLLGIVGLIIGDGGGNNLVDTLKYHSAFVLIYFGIECTIAMIVHHFIVVYEELAWQYPNPMPEVTMSSPSMLVSTKTMTLETTNGILSGSNKVACDINASPSFIEFATMGSIPIMTPPENPIKDVIDDTLPSYEGGGVVEDDGKEVGDLEVARSANVSNKGDCDVDVPSFSFSNDTVVVAPSPENHTEGVLRNTELTNEVEKCVEEDGNEEGDLEEARDIVSQSVYDALLVTRPPVSTPVLSRANSSAPIRSRPTSSAPIRSRPTSSIPVRSRANSSAPIRSRANSIVVHVQLRVALAFDGITRRASNLHRNILTHEIMVVMLKRHEFVCIEIDKLFCVVYQLLLWEVVMWLAQTFLALYLQSVNTPTLPATQDGYYCQTPLDNAINSAQFVNDLVFARR